MNFNNTTNSTDTPSKSGGNMQPFAPPGFTTENVVATVFFVCLTIGIVFGNSLVICAFKVNRRLRTTTNYFIISLAVADLLIGSISVPLWVYFSVTYDTKSTIYDFWLTFDIICGVSSILNMTMISLERSYALLRPIQHRNVSKQWFVGGAVTAWFLAALAGSMRKFPGVKPQWYGFVVTSVFFFVPLIIILAAYGVIFHIARAHARGRGVRSFRKDLRIATTVAVVIGIFILCWSPFFALNFVFTYCQKSKKTAAEICAKIPPQLSVFYKWLQYGNSVCNPIIYGFRNKDFKKAFKHLLMRMCGRKAPLTRFDRSTYVRTARSAYVRSDSSFDESRSTIFPSRIPPPGMYDMRASYKKAMNNGRKKPIKIKQAKRSLANGLLALNLDAFNIQSETNGYVVKTANLGSSSDVTSSASEAKASDTDMQLEICPLAHANAAFDELGDFECDRARVSPLAQKHVEFLQTGHVNETFDTDEVSSLAPERNSPRRNRAQVRFEENVEPLDDQSREEVVSQSPQRQRKRSHSDTALEEQSENIRPRTNSPLT